MSDGARGRPPGPPHDELPGFFGAEQSGLGHEVDPAVWLRIDEFLAQHRGGRERLIPLLHGVQDSLGHVPYEVQEYIADRLGLSPVQVYGVVSFYHRFTTTPRAPYRVEVCMGTACAVSRGRDVLEALQDACAVKLGGISADGLFNLERVRCIGACDLAPAIAVNGVVHGRLTALRVRQLVQWLRGEARPDLAADEQFAPRAVAGRPPAEGSTVQVCAGTGCVAKGSLRLAHALGQALERGRAGPVRVERAAEPGPAGVGITGCRGLCAAGPFLHIPELDITYQGVREEDLPEIVDSTIRGRGVVERLLPRSPLDGRPCRRLYDLPFFAGQERKTLARCGEIDPESIEAALRRGAYKGLERALRRMRPEDVVEEMKRSGLQGRGGAGFPTGMKWQLVADAAGDEKFVVCNGDEGDPGAFADRSIMEGDPHAVIEGLCIAGYAVGARRGFIYARADYRLAVRRVRAALEQARERGFLGRGILGGAFDFDADLVEGAGAFVCGEETALLRSIEGRRGMPQPRPPYPAQKGLWGRPTLINNVETLASIPRLIAGGAADFARVGTALSKGTKVFALTGHVENVGLIEVPMGITLRQIVFEIGGGMRGGGRFKAAQTGGPSGGFLPAAHLDTPLDYRSIQELGSTMGSGGLVVLDETVCVVRMARFFMEFCVEESCGKCPPCRIGTRVMLDILQGILEGRGQPGDIARLESLGRHMKRTSLCGLGQNAPNPTLSSIRHFRAEYEAHIERRECPAGDCALPR